MHQDGPWPIARARHNVMAPTAMRATLSRQSPVPPAIAPGKTRPRLESPVLPASPRPRAYTSRAPPASSRARHRARAHDAAAAPATPLPHGGGGHRERSSRKVHGAHAAKRELWGTMSRPRASCVRCGSPSGPPCPTRTHRLPRGPPRGHPPAPPAQWETCGTDGTAPSPAFSPFRHDHANSVGLRDGRSAASATPPRATTSVPIRGTATRGAGNMGDRAAKWGIRGTSRRIGHHVQDVSSGPSPTINRRGPAAPLAVALLTFAILFMRS